MDDTPLPDEDETIECINGALGTSSCRRVEKWKEVIAFRGALVWMAAGKYIKDTI